MKRWFPSERFQGIDFRSLHQVFPLLGMKMNMSILLCAKRDFFFWERFVGGCCGTQPKDIAKIRKIVESIG